MGGTYVVQLHHREPFYHLVFLLGSIVGSILLALVPAKTSNLVTVTGLCRFDSDREHHSPSFSPAKGEFTSVSLCG